MKKWSIIFCLILVGCIDNSQFKQVNYSALFHDNSSKVWMLNKVLVGDKNYAPKYPADKDVLIFYDSGRCYFQSLKNLGVFPGKKGEFSVYSEEKQVTLYFKNERWDFKIVSAQDSKVILKPTKSSDLKYKLEIIPFPELNF